MTIIGGCVCGAIRYECAEEPILMFNCHCRTCQMSSGGPYTPVVLLSSKAFRITKGELKYYFTDSVREKHPNKRGFCADCGSRITGGESRRKLPWVGVTASSLDDPSLYRPASEVFTSHAQAWDILNPALPHHEQYPPS